MRDLLITLFILGAIPYILQRPHIGILMWSWIGYMNPHRYGWGFAYSMPFALITIVALLIGMIFSKEKKTLPVTGVTIIWILFFLWAVISTLFATNIDNSLIELSRFSKIQFAVLCTLLLMTNKERLMQLVWVIVVSIGFFGVKGGIFSIAHGLQFRVNGPPESFISGNNEIALAILMIIPLMYFLKLHTQNRYIRLALLGSMVLCAIAVIGSYSRGALLAGGVTLIFLWFGMKHKVLTVAVVLSLGLAIAPFIPEQWYNRMNTIESYSQDASALGRINAWHLAVRLANDRPLTGGGFRSFTPENFKKYAPDPKDVHDVHSIYFEVLGEMGYVGIFLFLVLWLLVFIESRYVYKWAIKNEELKWLADLAKMSQVGLLAYLSGGAFLGLAFFDLPYHLMCLIVLSGVILRKHQKEFPEKTFRRARVMTNANKLDSAH